MKKLSLLFLLLWPALRAITQPAQDSAWIRSNYTKIQQYIAMRDGIRLYTTIYMPNDKTELHPILMTRTPYSSAPYGAGDFPPFWNSDQHLYYLRNNYILVQQDVRGRWMSEGEFVNVRPFQADKKLKTDIDEASDTYDTIDWLVGNLPGNNGRVGVYGISYPGFYSTMAAASGHPALKAVSPQAPVTDWFVGDDFHHNGAFFQMDAFSFYSGFGKPRPGPTTIGPKGFEFYTKDNYKFYLEAGSLKKLTEYMGDSIAFWKELMAHPNYDDWWKARDARNAMNGLKPAMLWVGGLFDAEDCWGAWNSYKASEKKNPSLHNKIVMGPWYHGQWARGDGSLLGNIRFGSNTSAWYRENIEHPFFDHYLRGKGSEPGLAEATIFFTGQNEWKRFSKWPPAGITTREIFFDSNGRLSDNRPTLQNSYTSYTSDPAHPVPYTEGVHESRTREYMTDDQRFASRRPDVLSFQTGILENDMTLAGPVIANLRISTDATDIDLVIKIIDVFPDDFIYPGDIAQPRRSTGGSYPMGGYQMLVRGEVMRGKFRKDLSRPVPFTPGKIETVRFELPDIAHTFKKGHRLMVQVQSSWFPLVDRNLQYFTDIYTADPASFRKATIKLYHAAGNASSILVPFMKE